jgi:hypothetical protein
LRVRAVCGPYLAIEKLASLLRLGPSLATHPAIGMVISGCDPLDFVRLTKLSADSPATPAHRGGSRSTNHRTT